MSQIDQTIDRQTLEARAVNTIRALAIDGTQAAGSGHPGMPMGSAAMAYVLWTRFLKHNPQNPQWHNRDRYVQSAGHGSMLIYSLLHLSGYDLPMAELQGYRRWGSKTPGHPEYGLTPGIEITTGPLGQGISSAVGMALAEAHLSANYNRPGHDIVDHYSYVIASDGDLMEGVSGEASSLAGHLGLGKLIVLYDDNKISIDGKTDITFSEDVLKRYEAYGWHTQRVEDGNDLTAIEAAITTAKNETAKPSIIAVRTIIGYGAPNQGSSAVHGAPLGEEKAALAKENLGALWPAFTVPEDVLAHYRQALKDGEAAEQDWRLRFERYKESFPELAAQYERVMAGEIPGELAKALPVFEVGKSTATRNSSQQIINALAAELPQLLGGSADLAESNKTTIKGVPFINHHDYAGRNIHFGVREHGMAAVANGLSLHGGLRPYVATFLIFSDYLRPSLRLAALMHQPVIYVFTHDSIGLGGDGPTHQPIEQLMALRAIPNVTVIRPADANESAGAWLAALEHKSGPTVLALSRQNLPHLDVAASNVKKGAYVLADSPGTPEVILIGTGSEVHVCLAAKQLLAEEGIAARVISMPSFELFDAQGEDYREAILPASVRARVAVEAGASLSWQKYVGLDGGLITLDRFGASADGAELMEKFGFTAQNVVETAKKLLA